MKKDTHPEYYPKAKVACACGNSFVTGSVQKEIKTDMCSNCHPFYTGKQKLVDTARRVEKYQAKVDAQKKVAAKRSGRSAKRAKRAAEKSTKEVTVKLKDLEKKSGKK